MYNRHFLVQCEFSLAAVYEILGNHIFVVNVKLCKQILRYFVTINIGLVYYKRFCLQLFIIIRFNVLSKVARELFSCCVVQLTA